MKERLRRNFFLLIGIISLMVLCVALCFPHQNSNSDEVDILDRIVGVVAIISGGGSVIMGISSILSTSLDNVREYYATGDSTEMAASRRVLYNYRYIKIKYNKTVYDDDFDEWVKKNINPKNSILRTTNKEEVLAAAAKIANFFQLWGLLQKKGFLPMWVFETASGYSVIKLYEAASDVFSHNRSTNPFYALQFKDLCVRIASKYRKDISKCRQKESEYLKKELDIKKLSDNKYFNYPLND